jgi:dipeptidyl aminopeptidase/acylaminoacyl peptidase
MKLLKINTVLLIIFMQILHQGALSAKAIVKKKNICPKEVLDIKYLSFADSTKQPMLFYAPKTSEKVPLLVVLHAWSMNYKRTAGAAYARFCIKNNWALCVPNFRGPNRNPDACGSELVVGDIVNAVEYAKTHASIDSKRIYLVGVSGGGYASLLMAGRRPDIWAGVSAWVPIYDLKDWHSNRKAKKSRYYKEIEKVCGGAPGTSPEVDEQYKRRSASTWLPNARNVAIEISGGIHDTTIPVSHTLRAFNALAKPEDRISQQDIEYIDKEKKLPGHMKMKIKDRYYRNKALFRRKSNNVRVTIFNGGHQIFRNAALNFLGKQEKGKTVKNK